VVQTGDVIVVLDAYFLIKLAHILLFVYWLGGDIGVFYSASWVRNRKHSIEARRTAQQILAWLDQIPRYCLVLMLPVGYALAPHIGAARVPEAFHAIMWGVALVWLWVVWAIHRYAGSPLGERLRRIDLGWRWILVAGLAWDAWTGFRGDGHLLTDWVSLKFAIFAALIFCGIMLRILRLDPGTRARRAAHRGAHPAVRPGDLGAARARRVRRHLQAAVVIPA
jgi:hypothetical protein